MKWFSIFLVLWICANVQNVCGFSDRIVTNFTINLVKSAQIVVFGCNRKAMQRILEATNQFNQFQQAVDIRLNYTLNTILTRKNHARTTAFLDCACNGSQQLLKDASDLRYFNKTYQWLLWDTVTNLGVQNLLVNLEYLGPNAQITYVNVTKNFDYNDNVYTLWDVHTKGMHLHAPLQLKRLAVYSNETFVIHDNVFNLQGIQSRDQFNALNLRGVTVIDQDGITKNEQIERILKHPTKDFGVAAFTKYHYELLSLLRNRFNFSVNFRNARGWAGRLGDTKFRLGFLGIITRNEADIGASAAFNRINRIAEFDIIHQSWKFETAFLYRFTPELDTHRSNGNFLAPFNKYVWILSAIIVLAVIFAWYFIELAKRRQIWLKHRLPPIRVQQQQFLYNLNEQRKLDSLSLNTFAAVCQQGIDPMPHGWSSRTIILSIFVFSLLMYNYYTSSVVGGLLSGNGKGPATVDEIISSRLKLSFEDIGYYKVLFRENKTPIIKRLILRKVETVRESPNDLPVYSHIYDAIPYLRSGKYAFHCEVVDAYLEIAKEFNANEICELRVVAGLMESEMMNFVVHKNSQYTELFRIMTIRLKEVGIIHRLLRERQPKKPQCQAFYIVYPVNLSGVVSAFFILGGGILLAFLILLLEIWHKNH